MHVIPSHLNKVMRPALLFLKWIHDDINSFKEWIKENRVSLVFDGLDHGVFILGHREKILSSTQFNKRIIFKAIRLLDGLSISDLKDDKDDQLVFDDEVEPPIVETIPGNTSRVIRNKLIRPEKDEILSEVIDNKKKELPNKDAREAEDNVKRSTLKKEGVLKHIPKTEIETEDKKVIEELPADNKIKLKSINVSSLERLLMEEKRQNDLKKKKAEETMEVQKDIAEETDIKIDLPINRYNETEVDDDIVEASSVIVENDLTINPNSTKSIFDILDSKIPNSEKGLEIIEEHQYTNLRNSNETKEVSDMRRKMLADHGVELSSVVDTMKKHIVPVKIFKDVPPENPYSKNTFQHFHDAYKENLKDSDFANILISPSNATFPLFLEKMEKINITDNEFKGYRLKLKYRTHNNRTLNASIKVPELLDDGTLYIGGSKKLIQLQDANKPVIKNGDSVIVSTAYNKIFVEVSGKFISYEQKKFIKALSIFNDDHPVFKARVTTTSDSNVLESHVYRNLVSTNLLALCDSFIRVSSPDISIDFRGASSIDNEEKLNEYNKSVNKDILENNNVKNYKVSILGIAYGNTVYHIPETDRFIWNNILYNTHIEFLTELCNKIDRTSLDLALKSASTQTYKQIKFYQVELLNRKIPIIYILMTAISLSDILKKLKDMKFIDYKLYPVDTSTRKYKNTSDYGFIRFADRMIVIRYINKPFAELLFSPLVSLDLSKEKLVNITQILQKLVGSSNFLNYVSNFVEYTIDPMTERVLKFYGLPYDFVGLMIYSCMLLTSYKTTYPSDASNYRLITTEELINRILYEKINKAVSIYTNRIKAGGNPTLDIREDAVLEAVLGLRTLAEYNPLSPFRTLIDTRNKSYSGHLGINASRAYSMVTRMFNDNSLGTETASTPYTDKAGVTKNIPMNVRIKDLSGQYDTSLGPDEQDASTMNSFVDSYIPFSDKESPPRKIMQNTQYKHVLPVADADYMLISSYADEIAAYMTPNFSYVAKMDGIVEEINGKFIKIRYNDSKVDIIPMDAVQRNSDKGYWIKNELVPEDSIKIGAKFKKDDIIAYNKDWFKRKPNGKLGLVVGPRVHVLICDADQVWEDSTILFTDLSRKLSTKVVKKISKAVAINSEIRNYITQIGKEVGPDDILFEYKNTSADVALAAIFANSDTLQLKSVKSGYKGRITDIKVFYRNMTGLDMSDSMKKYLKELTKNQKEVNNMSTVSNVSADELRDPLSKYTLDSSPTNLSGGKFSKVNGEKISDGQVMIEYYIEFTDRVGGGDKLVVSRALKLEPSVVYPEELKPVGSLSGKKPSLIIDTYSPLARMTGGLIDEGRLNLILDHIAITNCAILDIPIEKGSQLDYVSSKKKIKK